MALTHTVVLSKERLNELYGPVGRATLNLETRETFGTLVKWCDKNVGRSRYEIMGLRTWVFENEEDAMLFRLTWG